MTKPNESKEQKEPKQSIHYAGLPLISVLNRKSDMLFARDLLAKVQQLKQQEEEIKLELEDAMEALTELQAKSGGAGLRDGNLCFAHTTMPGRRTINRELLIENGVKAAVIEASMKEGKPYAQNNFKDLNRGKAEASGEKGWDG